MYEDIVRQRVGGYGIPAIPTKSAEQLCQSGYGKDAIPSYRLPLIYKDKYELVLIASLPMGEGEGGLLLFSFFNFI